MQGPTVAPVSLETTIDEVSEYLGIKKSSLYSKVERKEIPHYRLGSLLRFKKCDIDSWMEKSKVEPLDFRKRTRGILRGTGSNTTDIRTQVSKTIARITHTITEPNHTCLMAILKNR